VPRHGLGSSSGSRHHTEEKATWLTLKESSQLRDSAGFEPDFAIRWCPGDLNHPERKGIVPHARPRRTATGKGKNPSSNTKLRPRSGIHSTSVKRFLAFLILALAACTGAAETTTLPISATSSSTTSVSPTTSSSSTTTTTVAPTTTTAVPLAKSPLNGLSVEDDTLLDRRIIAVKIDNHWNARPQAGINLADAVFEIPVEANLTRFIALFHQSDAEYLGPMRSGRPTDPTVLAPLDATFVISGAQPWVQGVIRNYGVPFIGETRPATFRIPQRNAPHNLYVNTVLLRDAADARGHANTPPIVPMFDFRTNAGGEVATEIFFDWSSDTKVTWTWEDGAYTRSTSGAPQSWIEPDWETTGPITAETMVVIFASRYTASGSSGSSVPAMDTVGEGSAFVFSGGAAYHGTWSREDANDPFQLMTPNGKTLAVPPGRLWVSIFPDSRQITW